LDNAESYLRSNFADLTRHDLTLSWSHQRGTTELRVEPTTFRTYDGLLVSEQVTLTHTSPALAEISPGAAAYLNRWATLSTLIPGDAEHATRLVCKVRIFAPDAAAAEQVYAPLVCTEAAILGWHAASLSSASLARAPEASPLNLTADKPPYAEADFAACSELTDRCGYLSTAGPDEFTVEFPWDPGSVSNLFRNPSVAADASKRHSEEEIAQLAGRTSLLTLRTNEPHSLYGNGILARLELPLPAAGEEAVALVGELNRWELSGVDLPPLFGAWCLGPRAPTFVTFVPNQMAQFGLLQNLTMWSRVRALRVREWLRNIGTNPS
jgi:hypothetical protein